MTRLGLGIVNRILGALIALFMGAIALGLITSAWDSFWAGTADTPEEVATAVGKLRGDHATDCRMAGEHSSLGEIWECTVTSRGSDPITTEDCVTVQGQDVYETSCSYLKSENGGQPAD